MGFARYGFKFWTLTIFRIFGSILLVIQPLTARDTSNNIYQRDESNKSCSNITQFRPTQCKVQFLHEENDSLCIRERKINLLKQKHIFQITRRSKPKSSFSNVGVFSSSGLRFHEILPEVPWLNRTQDEILGYYSFNDEDAKYMGMFLAYANYMKTIEVKIRDGFFKKLGNQSFVPSFQVFDQINTAFQTQIKKLQSNHVINPCFDANCDELINNGQATDDLYFVQRRLAASCPFSLKKVTMNGTIGVALQTLKKKVNWDFDYDKAVTEANGKNITFEEAINKGILFVLYHPQHDNITKMSSEYGSQENRKVRQLSNPITFFVLKESGEFGIVSIQVDNGPGSSVLKPSTTDSESWLKAKSEVELADSDVCQAFYHAGKVHFSSTIYCLAYRHHIDKYHPLYDIFLHHCEGTVPHISLVFYTLLTPNDRADRMLSMGHEGFLTLGKMAFDTRMYGELDFPMILQSSGLDDERIKYYPFRDDASLLWEELSGFTNDIVQELYKTDVDVMKDVSIQSLANELSTDGLGNIPGFPAKFETKQALRLFLLRFLWFNVMHTSMNYPLNRQNHASNPTRLYDDNNGQPLPTYIQTLPDLYTAVNVSSFVTNIANFRANRILDYYRQVRHDGLQAVVENSYNRFHVCLQDKLSKRNENRRSKEYLTFEYFEPKYLTNSVHV